MEQGINVQANKYLGVLTIEGIVGECVKRGRGGEAKTPPPTHTCLYTVSGIHKSGVFVPKITEG